LSRNNRDSDFDSSNSGLRNTFPLSSFNDDVDSVVRPGSLNFVRGCGGKCDESGGLRNKQFPFLCHSNFQNYQITENDIIQEMWSWI
jgi:hypothetical protein